MTFDEALRALIREEVRAAIGEFKPPATTGGERFSVADLAARWSLHAKTCERRARAAVRAGKIDPVKVGRQLRLTEEEMRIALADGAEDRSVGDLADDLARRRQRVLGKVQS